MILKNILNKLLSVKWVVLSWLRIRYTNHFCMYMYFHTLIPERLVCSFLGVSSELCKVHTLYIIKCSQR